MAIRYQLRITAHTPRGEFVGTFGDSDESKREVLLLQEEFYQHINAITQLSLVVDPEREAITLNKKIIEESVFVSKVITILN